MAPIYVANMYRNYRRRIAGARPSRLQFAILCQATTSGTSRFDLRPPSEKSLRTYSAAQIGSANAPDGTSSPSARHILRE